MKIEGLYLLLFHLKSVILIQVNFASTISFRKPFNKHKISSVNNLYSQKRFPKNEELLEILPVV